jgi:acetylglutamate kinase
VNVNADLASAAVAAALEAQELIFLTDVDGLYEDYSDKSSLRSNIKVDELEELLPSLEKGMIPKVSAAITASFAGVKLIRIINGSTLHSLQRLNENPNGFGTRIER